jgi:hypothetical protein
MLRYLYTECERPQSISVLRPLFTSIRGRIKLTDSLLDTLFTYPSQHCKVMTEKAVPKTGK